MSEIVEIDHHPYSAEDVAHVTGALVVGAEMDTRVDRAERVATLIDPEGTLPDVELIPVPTRTQRFNRGNLTDIDYQITHQGAEIGRTTLVTDTSAGERWFNGIRINDEHRGAGFGMAAYKNGIVTSMYEGISFRTHGMTQSASAVRVWESLADKGVARVVEPFVPAEGNKYAGHYVVDAIEHT